MIRSMTGYGRAVETIDGREITAELRSVNNRYLDCTVKMPRIYAFAEDSVKTHVKSAISRGKVDVFIAVNVMEDMQMRISVNHPVLEGYLSAMRSIASDYGVRDDISVTALSRLPDVFVVEKAEEDEEKLTQDILSVVDKALEKFTAMRTTEGAALEADLRGRAATILTLVEKVEQRSPVTLAEYRARLKKCRRCCKARRSMRAAFCRRLPSTPTRSPWTRRPSACAATSISWKRCSQTAARSDASSTSCFRS